MTSPPLRDRPNDIPLLAAHFLTLSCRDNALTEVPLPADVAATLANSVAHYAWPGNIRELRNVIERLAILAGPVLSPNDLPPEIRGPDSQPGTRLMPERHVAGQRQGASANFEPLRWEEFKQRSERGYLVAARRATLGNISETARLLDVERSTIHKWLKSMRIERDEYLP